jgi:aryl sulfotransferase
MAQALQRYRNVVFDSLRWDGFVFRDDDIVISTPPKCGTTWMQMICALLIFRGPALPLPLTELSPWLDMQTAPVADVIAALEAQQHRRFIKTHTPLDGVPFDERVTYICVGRDPRDAALSMDNHLANMDLDVFLAARASAVGLDDLAELFPEGPPPRSDDPVERFWAWMDVDPAQDGGLSGMFHHFGTFWDRRHLLKVVLFHYADMEADLEGEMRRVAAALDIDVPGPVWPSLVAAATYDNMRSRADELAPEVNIAGFWRDNTRFFNRGRSGQWGTLMDNDGLTRYRTRVNELTPPDLALWAHLGSRAAKSSRSWATR